MADFCLAANRAVKSLISSSKNCSPCNLTRGTLLRGRDSYAVFNIERGLVKNLDCNIVFKIKKITGNGIFVVEYEGFKKNYKVSNSQRLEIPYSEYIKISRTNNGIGDISIVSIYCKPTKNMSEQEYDIFVKASVDDMRKEKDIGGEFVALSSDIDEDVLLKAQQNALHASTDKGLFHENPKLHDNPRNIVGIDSTGCASYNGTVIGRNRNPAQVPPSPQLPPNVSNTNVMELHHDNKIMNPKLYTNDRDGGVGRKAAISTVNPAGSILDFNQIKNKDIVMMFGNVYWSRNNTKLLEAMLEAYDIHLVSIDMFSTSWFGNNKLLYFMTEKAIKIICDKNSFDGVGSFITQSNNSSSFLEKVDLSEKVILMENDYKSNLDNILMTWKNKCGKFISYENYSMKMKGLRKTSIKKLVEAIEDIEVVEKVEVVEVVEAINIVDNEIKEEYEIFYDKEEVLGMKEKAREPGTTRFKIVIPAYNSERWIRKTLNSVAAQKYKNYDVCVVDDVSTDKNQRPIIKKHCETYSSNKNIWKHIFNNKRKGALFNIASAIKNSDCDDEDVIVTLDGDDWLYDDQVLMKLNKFYTTEDIWMTYGQYMSYPSMTKGHCRAYNPRIIEQRAYRKAEWYMSHLRTFKYKLWRRIKENDLIDPRKNRYYEMAWDLVMMFPMAEMAGKHIKFIDEYMYTYNRENPLNDDKVNLNLQVSTNGLVRRKPMYPLLVEDIKSNIKKDTPVLNKKEVDLKDRICVSDKKEYREFCKAATNGRFYEEFRRNKLYIGYVENVTVPTAKKYIEFIYSLKNNLLPLMGQFRENEKYGKPNLNNFGGHFGELSSTTVRYIGVMHDLYNRFGRLDDMNICEIGCGYGGQCKILHSAFNIKNYTMIDLPESLGLAVKYLKESDIKPMTYSISELEKLKNTSYDLVLSNYMFSETSSIYQKSYLNNIIKNSKNGLLICNFISDKMNIKSFNLNNLKYRLLDIGKKVQIIDENPLTFKDNKIISW